MTTHDLPAFAHRLHGSSGLTRSGSQRTFSWRHDSHARCLFGSAFGSLGSMSLCGEPRKAWKSDDASPGYADCPDWVYGFKMDAGRCGRDDADWDGGSGYSVSICERTGTSARGSHEAGENLTGNGNNSYRTRHSPSCSPLLNAIADQSPSNAETLWVVDVSFSIAANATCRAKIGASMRKTIART